jgi:hypothetical protein
VSSNDRHNRSSRQRPAPVPQEPLYDDEFLYEDEWEVDNDFEDPYQPQQSAPRRAAPQQRRRDPSTPSNQGTAAQLDRLRHSIRQQSGRPAAAQQGRFNDRRQSPQTGRNTPPEDDQIVDDDPYYVERHGPQQPSSTRRQSQWTPITPRQSSRVPTSRLAGDRLAYDPDSYEFTDDAGVYEDDFDEYDAPRRPARQGRQAPQIRMPNLSRPTLPPAIANADLVNDAPALGFIGVGLVSLAGMAILVANQVDSLAPQFATHVSASGVLENVRDESALWNLPLMAAMFSLMGIVMAWLISPIDRFASRFVLMGALVTQFVAWVALLRIL